jgi:hypothetical protein
MYRLEDLPVEILFEIFKYFKADELYSLITDLNLRMNIILKNQPNLKISTKNHLEPALSFFNSFTSLTINFNYQMKSDLYQFQHLNLLNIRSLRIIGVCIEWWTMISFDELNAFINPNRCPLVKYLHLPGCTTELVEFIFTGAFRYLKICSIKNYNEFIFSTSTTTSVESLRQLRIRAKNENVFEKILSTCSKLNSFGFDCYKFPSIALPNVCYPLMKYLKIARPHGVFFHTGEFDNFLSHFPNLLQLDLTVDQDYEQDEMIDFAKLADCFRHRIPHLNKLSLTIYFSRKYGYHLSYRNQFRSIAQMHELFRCIMRCQWLIYINSFDCKRTYAGLQHYIRPSTTLQS